MLKQALNHGLALRKVHRVIRFNQNVWLKSYIYMNSHLRRKSKNDFVKYFFKLINNAFFGKTMKNVRQNRDIKLITTKERRNYLVLEPTYHFTKFFTENVLAIKMKKTQVYINKPASLVFSVLELSEKLIHKFWCFWYDYVKPR